jgi:hypothetical protein
MFVVSLIEQDYIGVSTGRREVGSRIPPDAEKEQILSRFTGGKAWTAK